MRRTQNYELIKDFLERTNNSNIASSRPIYLSKEGSKVLMQKAKQFKENK
jgi:hypothetical protein